jgi:tRNA uridine 5-carboxymethylaminomethyl modification enzyme
LVVNNNKVVGVSCAKNKIILAKKIIITAGTYLNACTHIGDIKTIEGPQHLQRSTGLSDQLKKMGVQIIRLKTGTPPRILKSSINFKAMSAEPGTNQKLSFSHFDSHFLPYKKQVVCHLTYTNPQTHKIIKENIHKSAMYSGNISGVGPRYCPSIEDKIVRFGDRPRHQIFVEPESSTLNTMYLQGLSTSLPKNVQEDFVHTIAGLEKAQFVHHAYAIEYDAINPIQL